MSHGQHGPSAEQLDRLAGPETPVGGIGKASGSARYGADVSMRGMLWARFLGSPLAHARIRRVDAERARRMPGVHAVLIGEDVRGIRYGRRLLDRPVLAWDRTLFVGDRIAAVAAESEDIAEAALAEIEVDLEELPPILDVRAALEPGAPILHPEASAYAYMGGTRPAITHPNVQGELLVAFGAGREDAELEAVFGAAPHVFEGVFETPRQHAGYLEPPSTLVWLDAAGVAHVRTSNKTPFGLREQMALALGLSADRIDVEGGVIGGDFGGKGYTIDEYACLLLARATRRPVKSVTSQSEEFGATNVRHASTMTLRTAVDRDGTLLAHRADILFDGGAYANAKPLPHLALAGGVNTLAAYRIPHVQIDTRTVYTNTVPAGHMRSPGEVQALFAGKSHLDEIARALAIDPLDFRLRNAVREGDVGAAGDRFREARAVEVLEAVRRELPWPDTRRPNRGRGVALGVRHVGGGVQSLRLRLYADGRIEVPTGLADQGAGAHTVIRRVIASVLSVPEDRVTVTRVATAAASPDRGIGGSRVTHVAGRAAEQLGHDLLAWLDERLPAAVPDVPAGATLRDGRLTDPASGATLATFDELVARLVPADDPLELSAKYADTGHGPDEPGDYGFAATAVEVEVDPETGAVRVTDALVVADVGTIINPTAHRGQIEGAFAMGIGAALMEELTVDAGVMTSLSLADVRLPTSADVPSLRIVLLPTDVGPGPFGAKMAGELNNASVAPAVANAVADAVGARVRALPLSAERVLDALESRETSDTSARGAAAEAPSGMAVAQPSRP